MKQITKKTNNHFTFFLVILILLSVFLSVFYSFISVTKSSKAASSPCFTVKYHTLSINQNVQYKLKHMKKEYSVSYSISNPSLAHITKKSGILTPKKAGKITVKAVIYNKNQQKIKTLTNTVIILKQKNYLPNASFKVKKSINPWDFTISLSCSRILLKKEIQSDTLTIYPKGKNSPVLNACFSKLSKDGKEVTYTLNASSRSKLCPGNYSMDGNYILESTCFSKKLHLSYEERLPQNTLSGFVLQTDGSPIKNALISLKKGTAIIKKCYTDKYGHYRLRQIFDSDTLVVEKNGYQQKVLQNPAISKKGTACENIILRSLSDTSAKIKFLVTDTNNEPLPGASIQIFKDSGLLQNTHPATTDSYIKKSLLYSGNTDTSGILCLANCDKSFTGFCSNLMIQEKAVLSYAPVPNSSSEHTKILPSSVLNITDNYTIYINKFSTENPCLAYNTQKIQFSFHHLITNLAFIHIKLIKCSNTQVKNLKLYYKNSLSHCHSITLHFYHADLPYSFYQYTMNYEFFNKINDTLSITSYLPITLPDNNYFLSIDALTEDGMILAKSPILPITVQNARISLESATLYRPRYARALVYGDFIKQFPYTASFHLFQKCDDSVFFIDTCFSTPFTKNMNHLITANLLLSSLLPEQNYFLFSAAGDISTKELLSFSTTQYNTFLSEENAVFSNMPILQIHCINDNPDTGFLKEFSSDKINIKYHNIHNISENFIRSSQNYPNSVTAVYQKNGRLLTTVLTIPPANHQKIISTATSNIIDIYTNNEILITNQDF